VLTLLLPFLGGAAAALVYWAVFSQLVDQPLFARQNFRDRTVPVAGGLVLMAAVLTVAALHAVSRAALLATDAKGADSISRTLLAVLGFGVLGLLDDLAGPGDPTRGQARGFKGHVGAAVRGHVSTGMVKLLGGVAVAAVVVPIGKSGVDAFARDALLVALAANLGNLLDRRPGRALKVGLLCALPLVVFAVTPVLLSGAAAVAGAGVALLVFDVREKLMLGDGGANPFGGALGLAVVLAFSPDVRLIVLLVLVGLNAISEVVSFSAVIDRVPPLRFLDHLGRVRGEGSAGG
jgi:UDP-N-acetylmuramyl pentapeptide phosphotransferase/UDP-N-acetylglucosamine-1-phosphate transferase